MHTLARRRTAWRNALAVVLLLEVPISFAVACSSSSANPPELSSQDTGIPDRFEAAQPEPTPKPEPMPEPVPEAAPEAEAEAGCMPLNDSGIPSVVSSTSLTFDDEEGGLGVACGTQAAAQTVTLVNETCAPFQFSTQFSTGSSYYTVSPANGTVPAQGLQIITINPFQIPQNGDTAALAADYYAGVLGITTTAPGDAEHLIQLHMTAYGAILTASPNFGSTLNFNASIGTTETSQFTVTNGGNASATVSFAAGSQYYTVTAPDGGGATATIAAGPPVTENVTFSPTSAQTYPDTISAKVASTTVLCGPAPVGFTLAGTGSNGVTVKPGNLTFGLVKCGSPAAAPQNITISNTGIPVTYSATLQGGASSPYTLEDGNNNPIAQGAQLPLPTAPATVTIQVIPNAITNPASTTTNAYGDTLTIATTASGDSPHTVTLQETAQGAIFVLSPNAISANTTPGASTFVPFTVANTGNASASYTLAVVTTKGPPNTFTSNLLGGTLNGGSTPAGGELTCIGDPSDAGNVQDLGTLTLTPAVGTVLCADPPPATPLSVTN